MKIRTKLIFGFALIFTILALASLYTAYQMADTNDKLSGLVDVSARRIILSNNLTLALLDLNQYEKDILVFDNKEKLQNYAPLISASIGRVDGALDSLQQIVAEERKGLLTEFQIAWVAYKKALPQMLSLALSNQPEAAHKLSTTEGTMGRIAAISMVSKIIVANEADMLADRATSEASYNHSVRIVMILIIGALLTGIMLAYWIITSITHRISGIARDAQRIASREYSSEPFNHNIDDELFPVSDALTDVAKSFQEVTQNAEAVAAGNYQHDFVPRSSNDLLGNALKLMTQSLRNTTAENVRHNWLSQGQNKLNENLRGELSIEQLASNTINFLCSYVGGHTGVIYIAPDGDTHYHLAAHYAMAKPDSVAQKVIIGEGVLGQVALSQKAKLIEGLKEPYMKITSSFIDAALENILVSPFVFDGVTLGVIEIGKLTSFESVELEFIDNAMEGIAISLNSAIASKRIIDLNNETQLQSEELYTQQEELRQLNEELEEHTQNLRQQQEELQVTNEELEEQTQLLEAKNSEVELARKSLEDKSTQLEVSSGYKSEFLANMSHELRTPLNSLLILSRDLAENKGKNLSEEQVESAEIINKSGHDLLNLINEVLDLSKIEAGKMTLSLEDVNLAQWAQQLYKNFRRQADEKSLDFKVHVAENVPVTLRTDLQRLDQVVKNLLSNAIKFTKTGSVKVEVKKAGKSAIDISIIDTGIGIALSQQVAVFNAFQQAESGTARTYGGTGLGLSISRKLADLLGGEITLQSLEGEGSTFSLLLPIVPPDVKVDGPVDRFVPSRKSVFSNHSEFLNYPTIPDDRNELATGDKVLLIIEDDKGFATVLARQAHSKGFKIIAAGSGEDGVRLAAQYLPNAIILDIELPGMNGHKVLAELKSNPLVRHIPVHIMSIDERSIDPIKEGAVEYLTKPISKKQMDGAFARIENFIARKMKNLLIVEDDETARKIMSKLIGNGDVKCLEAGTGKEGLEIATAEQIDCIVLDLGLPDMNGFEFIERLHKIVGKPVPPIVIYTGRELTREENAELEKHAETIIIKGVKSEERLLDETALFLHRTVGNLPESKQQMINSLYDKEAVFSGKKVLVVDDDMRNVFALSKVLKERSMEVVRAENGQKALDMLDSEPGIDLVLMDIMMPEMDGYEAMRLIRAQPKFDNLVILALTAKAMKDDRQKCIDAGANDYIPKPIDVERLLSLMRIWLNK